MDLLKDKVALITGGSSGIGLATAQAMIEAGAKVIIAGRNQQRLDAAIAVLGDHAMAIRADVSSVAAIEKMLLQIKSTYGRIDILFANAGMSECPPVLATDEYFFDAMMNSNVKSVFFLFTKAFPLLSAYASVIFTSSVAHSKGRPGDPLYTATKAAVRSLGRTLAMDEHTLARHIRVNVVSPGAIQTPLTQQETPELDKMVTDYIKASVPMARWGQAGEVAKAVLFLASPASSYMTAGEITVDGGLGHL